MKSLWETLGKITNRKLQLLWRVRGFSLASTITPFGQSQVGGHFEIQGVVAAAFIWMKQCMKSDFKTSIKGGWSRYQAGMNAGRIHLQVQRCIQLHNDMFIKFTCPPPPHPSNRQHEKNVEISSDGMVISYNSRYSRQITKNHRENWSFWFLFSKNDTECR